MKKALKSVSLLVLAIIIAFSFAGCYCGGFLSANQIDSLGNKLGLSKDADGNFINPTAVITFEYSANNGSSYESNVYRVMLKYELLFDKAPITVNNFIALANAEFYNGTLVDTINKSYTVMGRYKLDDNSKFELQKQDFTIKGEFEANGWYVGTEEENTNALHALGSLGMYHATQTETVNYFDSASTAFYIVWTNSFGSSDTISNGNYAVFANVVGCAMMITGGIQGGYYNAFPQKDGQTVFEPNIDSNFQEYMINASTTSGVDTDGTSLTGKPSSDIKILSVKISGATGEADTTLRNKA